MADQLARADHLREGAGDRAGGGEETLIEGSGAAERLPQEEQQHRRADRHRALSANPLEKTRPDSGAGAGALMLDGHEATANAWKLASTSWRSGPQTLATRSAKAGVDFSS